MQIFKLLKDRKGATAIEYVLLASMFALVCITAVFYLHDEIVAMYDGLGESVESANL